jgi:DNA-binding MltR family transcriptional regulator
MRAEAHVELKQLTQKKNFLADKPPHRAKLIYVLGLMFTQVLQDATHFILEPW